MVAFFADFGVSETVEEHVPAFSVFTVEPLTLDTFADDATTLMTTFDEDAMVMPALVARHERVMALPFFTEHLAAVAPVDDGTVVVTAGRVVLVVEEVVVTDDTHTFAPMFPPVSVPAAHAVCDVAPGAPT